MADISPQVISKLSQVMFSKNEPPVTSVIWAKPLGGSKRSYAFLVFTEGRWQNMSSGGDIPKDISYFNNDVGYITMADLPEFSSVAYSGDYTDLINTPTIPDELKDLASDTTHRVVTDSEKAMWNSKQSYISDLGTIRAGALKGATAYQKPSTGIPSADMSSDVQTSLGKADTALQSFTETDPTVPSWAKASHKPFYTASEVGAVPTTRTVNGKALSSNISLTASDVGALPDDTTIPTITFIQW